MLPSTALSLRSPAIATALRHTVASAAIAMLGMCSLAAHAQSATGTSATPERTVSENTLHPNPTTAAGRTRAEVVAELVCARESGEMDAALLRTYGLDMGTTVQPRHCAQAVATEASAAPRREAQ